MARKQVVVWVQSIPGRPFLYLQWHDPTTGKRRSRSTGTANPDEAERLRADLEYEFRHRLYVEPSRTPWPEFVRRYLAEVMASRRPNTQRAAKRVLEQFGKLANIKTMEDVNERAVSQFTERRRAKGFKEITLAGNLAYLRAALRWAARQKFLRTAPAIDLPKLPKKLHIKTISRDDWGKIIVEAERSQPEWVPLLWTAWHTGMRRGELMATRWANDGDGPWIDLERDRIWIPAQWAKADADSWLPIHPDLRAILAAVDRPSNGPAFLNERCDPSDVSRTFRAICERAGVRAKLHDIRRTFGTRYAHLVHAHVLQRLMRHASISTTLKYYADLDDGLADAIRRG